MTAPPDDPILHQNQWPMVEDARLLSFLRHWAEARRGGIVPKRSAIDPTAIASCLPHIFMSRYAPDIRDFVLTLVGDEIRNFWGAPLVGKSTREMMGGVEAELAIKRGHAAIEIPALLYSRASRITRPDTLISITRLTAPLHNDEGGIFGTIGMSIHVPLAPAPEDPLPDERFAMYDCRTLPATAP